MSGPASQAVQGYKRGGLRRYAVGARVAPQGGLSALSPRGASPLAKPGAGPVQGPGGGQDDLVPADLSPSEYVWDADTVSSFGDGDAKEGARKLDKVREAIRAHKRSAPANKIPPKAKPFGAYMQGVK